MPSTDLLSVDAAAKILNKTHVAIVNLCHAKVLDGGFNEVEVGYRITADSVRQYAAREESRKAHPATSPLPRHTVDWDEQLSELVALTAENDARIRTLIDVEESRALTDDPLDPARGLVLGLVIGLATWVVVGVIYLAVRAWTS